MAKAREPSEEAPSSSQSQALNARYSPLSLWFGGTEHLCASSRLGQACLTLRSSTATDTPASATLLLASSALQLDVRCLQLNQTGSAEGNNCDEDDWGVQTSFTAQPGQDYLVVWGGLGRERKCEDSEVGVAIS